MTDASEVSLTGRLERITFHNPDTRFTIARLRVEETRSPVTIKGTLPDPKTGETLSVYGKWETHPRYGQQLRFDRFVPVLPATVDGIRHYLSSGFIKGIGAKRIDQIIRHFEADTLAIIESSPERLCEVEGIGKKTARQIADAWKSHHAVRRLMQFLEQNRVDTRHAARLMREYGPDAADILCNEPYRVADDIPGIGFVIADAVVRHADTPVNEADRARACIRHIVEQAVSQGHTCILQDDLFARCRTAFELSPETAAEALESLVISEAVVVRKTPAISSPLIFPAEMDQAEQIIANRIIAMQTVPLVSPLPDMKRVMGEVRTFLSIHLSAPQEKILGEVLSCRVSVITGGPGTGKTTLIRSITAAMESMGNRVMLTAPTGRAARRLSEVTGKPAATLHKALGFNLSTGTFDRTETDPLEADGVIVDEASMIDTGLMAHLMRAVPMTARLILVGDVFQLPSVGPGTVLSDLIQSGIIPTFELTEIFRQAAESPIVISAHKVRKGLLPDLPKPDAIAKKTLFPFHFIEEDNPEAVVQTLVELCTKRIPAAFQLDPIRDIQVLAPMHRGLAGTLHLNQVLQAALNPATQQVDAPGARLKPGDKVMHLRNNYQKSVFNGDIGIIRTLDTEKSDVVVDYDDREVRYDFIELDELALAYAISVHKSQGSEYPAVIIPLVTQHYVMLQRNLIYTALTRARQLVVLVGSTKALKVALGNDKPRQRLSFLAQRLGEKPLLNTLPPEEKTKAQG
ncbi:ATP-dependent RecD-like DNA helicase [Desulfosarcina sp. OttesenSCG-928-A07]|nr:ATP-dependent RecD-like DNA helicase [Desulfosarcina sp. OttesenSCG-928-A07]